MATLPTFLPTFGADADSEEGRNLLRKYCTDKNGFSTQLHYWPSKANPRLIADSLPADLSARYRMPNSGIQSLGPRGPADFAPPDRGMPLQMCPAQLTRGEGRGSGESRGCIADVLVPGIEYAAKQEYSGKAIISEA